jgi:hypothetical protein
MADRMNTEYSGLQILSDTISDTAVTEGTTMKNHLQFCKVLEVLCTFRQ